MKRAYGFSPTKLIVVFAAAAVLFALVIVSVTLHHNHEGGDACPHKDCVACSIHLNCITTVPLIVIVFTSTRVEFLVFRFDGISPSPFFCSSTASRAPPIVPI